MKYNWFNSCLLVLNSKRVREKEKERERDRERKRGRHKGRRISTGRQFSRIWFDVTIN